MYKTELATAGVVTTHETDAGGEAAAAIDASSLGEELNEWLRHECAGVWEHDDGRGGVFGGDPTIEDGSIGSWNFSQVSMNSSYNSSTCLLDLRSGSDAQTRNANASGAKATAVWRPRIWDKWELNCTCC
eukprot:SAG31_NODE_5699_length_2373_cov_5.751099_1_plen_130_part_00